MGKRKKCRDEKKEGEIMTATKDANKARLSAFIKQNKDRLYADARRNTNYDKDGRPTISKDDEWFNEDVWDRHHERMIENK